MNQYIEQWFEKNTTNIVKLAMDIFDHPEVASEEQYACMRTAEYMESQGFEVQKIIVPPAAAENGVIARWGKGRPVIGILGEYDALPGLGQESVPYRKEIPGNGHGCGHCNMNAGCSASAVALRQAMEQEQIEGTIVYLACPAEENLSGKTRMLADGWFDGIDICLAWHPGGPCRVSEETHLAMSSLKFEFSGKAAHASGEPWDGKSALDAAQLMNLGVEFLREHVTDDVRIHYVFEKAGQLPNVVPDYASLHYYVRAFTKKKVNEVRERVFQIARGAALMTETEVRWQICVDISETLLNHTLNQVLYGAMQKVPQIRYSAEDQQFAHTLYQNAIGKEAHHELLPEIYEKPKGYAVRVAASTDVSAVSQYIPTAQLLGGGLIMGISGHTWACTATTGSPIGHKGAIWAGKVLAQCGYDIFKNPEIVKKCRAELEKARVLEDEDRSE